MSEALVNALISKSLDLQQAVMPELIDAGSDRVNNPTFAGLGRAALYEWGAAVIVDARLWNEQELRKNGTLFVEINHVIYRIEIRQDSLDIREIDSGDSVTDVEILENIIFDISFMHEMQLYNSEVFEDTTDKVLQ